MRALGAVAWFIYRRRTCYGLARLAAGRFAVTAGAGFPDTD